MINGFPSIQAVIAFRSKHAEELRESWQGKLLGATGGKGVLFAVVVCMLAHSFYEALDVLLRAVFPHFARLTLPLFSGTATIMPTGQVVCGMYDKWGRYVRHALVFQSEDELTRTFRDMADKLALADPQREELFAAVQRWVAADRRIKETGEKVA